MGSPFPARPIIATKEIKDTYIRKNFEELRDYFENQNQLLDFLHLEVTITQAVTNEKIAHTLGFLPKDIIVTKIVGEGTWTWNYSEFSKIELDITTTGPVRLRFYVGTYYKDTASLENDETSDIASIQATLDAATVSGFLPGMFMGWAAATAPSGWLICDGTEKSRTEFAALFAAIGEAHGEGNGRTTFHIPDYRDRNLRGVGGSSPLTGTDKTTRTAMAAGGNTGNEVGSIQADAFQNHLHNFDIRVAATDPGGGSVTSGTVDSTQSFNSFFGSSSQSLGESDGAGTPRSASETRGKNAYVNWIIKT